jgi:hypothetical protein
MDFARRRYKLPLPVSSAVTIRSAEAKGSRMHKVSISQAWDETRGVLERDGKLIATVALAMLVLPGVAASVLLPKASMTAPGAIGYVALLAVFLITFAGQLSIVRLAMGPHLTVAEAIRHGAIRTLPYAAAFLLWLVPFILLGSIPYKLAAAHAGQPTTAAAIALLALTALGMFLVVRLLLTGPVATAEHVGPISIIRRSWDLTAGNWWRLFGFVAIFVLGAVTLIWAVTAVIGLIGRVWLGQVAADSVPGLIIMLVVQAVTSALYCILFIMQARIYVQLSGRGEPQAGVPSSGT